MKKILTCVLALGILAASCKPTQSANEGAVASEGAGNDGVAVSILPAQGKTSISVYLRSLASITGAPECQIKVSEKDGIQIEPLSPEQMKLRYRKTDAGVEFMSVHLREVVAADVTCGSMSPVPDLNLVDNFLKLSDITFVKEKAAVNVDNPVVDNSAAVGANASSTTASSEFPDADLAWGKKLAAAAKWSVIQNGCGRGMCFQCVANAIDHAMGRALSYGALNQGYCARSFADFWNPGVHEKMFKLRKIKTSDRSILPRIPVGSVVVTAVCGRSDGGRCQGGPGYGDIAIKLNAEGQLASFFIGTANYSNCKHAQLLAVFIPIK